MHSMEDTDETTIAMLLGIGNFHFATGNCKGKMTKGDETLLSSSLATAIPIKTLKKYIIK